MTSFTQNDTNSFDQLLESLASDPNAKGNMFEQVCKWVLRNYPGYTNELANVWTWDEWSGRWGADKGLDLVAETYDSKLGAIQAKGYEPDNSMPRNEIYSFIVASARSEFGFTDGMSKVLWLKSGNKKLSR